MEAEQLVGWVREVQERGREGSVSMHSNIIHISSPLTPRHFFEDVYPEKEGKGGIVTLQRVRLTSS
jgi:hypothetical protein